MNNKPIHVVDRHEVMILIISLTGSSSLNRTAQQPQRVPCFRTARQPQRVPYLRVLTAPSAPIKEKYTPPSSVAPSVHPPKTESAPVCIVSPRVSVKSDLPESDLKKTLSELLHETDSTASTVSVQSLSTRFDPPFFDPRKTQSEWETDSTDSGVSMRSASSMSDPPNFNLHRKQSCAVCEEAVKDPVRLPCGHWSCKQCVISFWDQYGLTADDPCKKCGRRSEREKRDQDLQSVLLEKNIKRVETETEKSQAEKEKFQAEKEKFLAEKETSQAEKEKFQAEKEKFLAEKETSQAEKEKFQAEKEKSQAEKEKFELEKRKLALEIQSLEQ